jgi:hypothetical protein
LLGGSGMRESRSRPSTIPGYGKILSDGDHISPSPKPFGLGEYASNSLSFSSVCIKAHYWYMNMCHSFSSWSRIYTCWQTIKLFMIINTVEQFLFVLD